VQRLGQAEVQHLDLSLGRDLDVRRLEVPVEDTVLVGVVQRVGELPRDEQRLVHGDGAAVDAVGQRGALDQLHHQRANGWRPGVPRWALLDAVDRGNVLMSERGEDLRLALEPRHAVWIRRELRRQDFERDLALEAGVAR
jgi:hypothetical protein